VPGDAPQRNRSPKRTAQRRITPDKRGCRHYVASGKRGCCSKDTADFSIAKKNLYGNNVSVQTPAILKLPFQKFSAFFRMSEMVGGNAEKPG
jgi:hypothetical protein